MNWCAWSKWFQRVTLAHMRYQTAAGCARPHGDTLACVRGAKGSSVMHLRCLPAAQCGGQKHVRLANRPRCVSRQHADVPVQAPPADLPRPRPGCRVWYGTPTGRRPMHNTKPNQTHFASTIVPQPSNRSTTTSITAWPPWPPSTRASPRTRPSPRRPPPPPISPTLPAAAQGPAPEPPQPPQISRPGSPTPLPMRQVAARGG